MSLEIAVLVSVGRHPASLRARRADSDARALELALQVGGRVRVIHAGDPDEPALRDYLGMGVAELTVLRLPPGADALPVLVQHLRENPPALLLTGAQAEQGWSSGQLPYALAQALGYALVPAVAGIELTGQQARLLQALPRGRRRAVGAALPLLAVIDQAAPAPRQSAYGPAQRGQIKVIETAAAQAAPLWEERPARKRPKRLKLASGGSAAERLKAASGMQSGRGQLMVEPAPEEAAAAIYAYLVAEGIIQ